ncbi:hypothetical protein ACFQ6V_09545 [Streptomyces roseifaciens]
MSLDAMHWVWTRSTAKGAGRLVLLAIADKATGPNCTAYAGTTTLMQRTRAARSTVVTAVDKLLAAGELEIVTGRKGPRGETVYRLPLVARNARTAPATQLPASPTTGPVRPSDRSESRTSRGADSGPQEYDGRTPGSPDSGPHNQREHKHQEKQQLRVTSRASPTTLRSLQPFADALDHADVPVHWNLSSDEQQQVDDLIRRHGAAALIERSARRTVPGDPPKPARYWLRVWSDLDHTPAPTSVRTPAVPAYRLPGTRPHTNVFAAGLALLTHEGAA